MVTTPNFDDYPLPALDPNPPKRKRRRKPIQLDDYLLLERPVIEPKKPLRGIRKPGWGAICSSNDFFESRNRKVWQDGSSKPVIPHDWFYSMEYFNVRCRLSRRRQLLERVAWEHYRNCGPTSIGVWPVYTVPVHSFSRYARFLEQHVDNCKTYYKLFQEPLRSKLAKLTFRFRNPYIRDEYLAYMLAFNWLDPAPIDTKTGAQYDLRDLFFIFESGCLEVFDDSRKRFKHFRPLKNARLRIPYGKRRTRQYIDLSFRQPFNYFPRPNPFDDPEMFGPSLFKQKTRYLLDINFVR
jgi:hypothetical protein